MSGDLEGRVILVTGATAGIGKEAARQFAIRGATVTCVGRNPEKTRALVDELKSESGNERIRGLVGDLSRPSEAKRVAGEFANANEQLHVLFNNAGALFATRELTDDGLERTFALNHLSYFVITVALLELLHASAPARIVSTSSGAHGWGDLEFQNDWMTESYPFGGRRAYGRSKLANIWFTRELAKRLEGSRVTATCYHPGFVASDFARNNGALARVAMTIVRPFARTVTRGADTAVWLATSDEPAATDSGGYFADRKRKRGTSVARDEAAPARLWSESERIVSRLLGDDWSTLG